MYKYVLYSISMNCCVTIAFWMAGGQRIGAFSFKITYIPNSKILGDRQLRRQRSTRKTNIIIDKYTKRKVSTRKWNNTNKN